MSLVGFRYIQDTDPGAVGLGFQWLKSNGLLYERNTTNTAWVPIGTLASNNYGLVPVTGATMTGNLSGVTGWAPLASPNFTTSAKRDGIDLVDANELASAIDGVESTIDSKVSEAISTVFSTTSISKNNIAAGSGLLTPATPGGSISIPLPTYSDGSTASISDCSWSLSVHSIPDQGNGLKLVNVTNTSGVTYTAYAQRDDGATSVVTLSYIIIAIRG